MINKLSSIVKYQLPAFIREDHELFATFVQAYYQWLEEEGNLGNFMSRFQDNLDVDVADDEYLDEFIREFADTFPKSLEVDKSVLLKHIKEFYLSKGSEESFKFIFTVVYNTDVNIFYPRDVILKSSDGNYLGDDFMYITADNYFKLNLSTSDLNARVRGKESGHNAAIDFINYDYLGATRVLRLDISSYDGPFRVGEEVDLYVDEYKVTETVYGVINKINVVDGGTDYVLDDAVTITGGSGEGARAKISKLKKGSYTEYDIVAAGTGYSTGDIINAQKTQWGGYGFSAAVEGVGGSGEIESIRILNIGHNYDRKGSGIVQSTGSGATILLNGPNIGSIEEIEVEDSGFGFTTQPTVSVTSVDGVDATFNVDITAIYNQKPQYQDQDGFLSNYSRLQDSYYYQQFSYVIQSNVAPNEYVSYLKRIAHPAGTQLFGSFNLHSEFDVSSELVLDTESTISSTITLNYEVQYQTENEVGQTEYILSLESYDSCLLGFNTKDLDSIKFNPSFEWSIEPFLDITLAEVLSGSSGCGNVINHTESAQIDIS